MYIVYNIIFIDTSASNVRDRKILNKKKYYFKPFVKNFYK